MVASLAFLLPPFLPSSVRLPLFQCDASLVIAVVQTGSIFDPDKHKKYEAEYYYQVCCACPCLISCVLTASDICRSVSRPRLSTKWWIRSAGRSARKRALPSIFRFPVSGGPGVGSQSISPWCYLSGTACFNFAGNCAENTLEWCTSWM